MPRAKGGYKSTRRRNRIRRHAKGFRGGRSKLWKAAVEAVHHKWRYAWFHRRKRKGDFRALWIARINAAARAESMTYNRFISGLRLAGIQVDRTVLADIAVTDPRTFASLVTSARQGLRDANGSGDSGNSGKA